MYIVECYSHVNNTPQGISDMNTTMALTANDNNDHVLVSARASSGGGGDVILCDVLLVLTVHFRYPWSPGHLTTTTDTRTPDDDDRHLESSSDDWHRDKVSCKGQVSCALPLSPPRAFFLVTRQTAANRGDDVQCAVGWRWCRRRPITWSETWTPLAKAAGCGVGRCARGPPVLKAALSGETAVFQKEIM
ncbi:hypothetical protein C0Q70_21199 [Pomacea canaliculata]|uniref:Uncharacterized protein n=1 Tax=Pomacea canaliculata TaxID=400727 RepID=A0A2T7NBV6_POMCA|nr:hypothetical protein C0Q70_21199 [Pomacea canaliculata]